MTSVRTVTTVQTTGSPSGQNDNNLDALLEDLQTSVIRNQGVTNGVATGPVIGKTKIYREVTRTVKRETKPGYQVEYLAPANTTTVVAERAASPGIEIINQTSNSTPGVTSYKTVSYEYNTNNGAPVRTSEDARLRHNLTELDELLVDLHHAQKTGFGTTDQGSIRSSGRSRSSDTVPRSGVDPGLLEPFESSSPAPPSRHQHISRSMVQEQSSFRNYSTTGGSSSNHREPKRSSSVNRELIFTDSNRSTPSEMVTQQRHRSPSPTESPQIPRRNVHKEVFYEKRSTSSPQPQRYSRETSRDTSRYRDKSPSNQRLHREVYNYETKETRTPRYEEMSPPSQRRNQSPSPVRSTVRSNYTTTSTTSTTPRPYRSPSPIMNRSPYVENAPIVDLPRRSPSPKVVYQNNGPPTKVTTTVRTYTYELPPGVKPGSNNYIVQEPVDYPDTHHSYKVSPSPSKEPKDPPTVITYKYSSHQSSRNDDHLQPRPFPTPSPQPGPNGEPPKKLDDLMAQFGDTTEITQQRHHVPPHAEHNGVAVVAPSNVKPPPPPPAAVVNNNSLRNRGNSKNVAGPPVYYPPGVELFAAKEQEAKMTSSKASGEYEMSRESASKGSSGGATGGVVPVCLPVCCAMPCTIM